MVEFEYPVRHVAQEVAVVRDDDERALEVLEVRFKTERRFGVEVVCGLIEEQHVRLLQEQARNRHAAALAAGEHGHLLVGRRTPHVRHRHLHFVFDIPKILRVDDRLEALHLGGGLRVVEVAAEVLVAFDHSLRLGDALLHDLAHGLGIVELRLLWQVAHLCPLRYLACAEDVRIKAS